MGKPNFGECQIQQCLNSEFTLWARGEHKRHVSAVVPTLTKEKALGWDSGFFFPWLPYVPLADQNGCNFFLQYKLSTLMVGTNAKQYSDWREPYFRFKIPHEKKVNRHTVDDFHQYEALRALSKKQCEVYYATNQVTTRDELLDLAENQNLIDNTPFLDVRDVTAPHYYATFTTSSEHFWLHSEPTYARRVPGQQLKERVVGGEARSLAKDNTLLFEIVCELLANTPALRRELLAYEKIGTWTRCSNEELEAQRFVFLQAALIRYFNISMIRFWRQEG